MSESPRETPKHENVFVTDCFHEGGKNREGKGGEARERETSKVCATEAFEEFTFLFVLLFDALFKTSQLVLYLLCCFSFLMLYST